MIKSHMASPGFASEDIERSGERIFRQLAFAKRGKPINDVTEVYRLAG